METDLSLAYSPCPNDTFIFHALTHGLVSCGDRRFTVDLKDVEALNMAARQGRYHISKLSFAAIGHLLGDYGLLRSGAALGRGCGPLIVARPGIRLSDIKNQPIAVPGMWTTANLLLGLYLGRQPAVVPLRFDRIMPCIKEGDVDVGVIIHEGRFTYQDHGLEELLDLGAWWETATGLPIPLGGIAVKRSLPSGVVKDIERAIAASVQYAFHHPEASATYIRQHAQEMDPHVIDSHIDLYVNDFSIDLGHTGTKAVEHLFELAAQNGLIEKSNHPLFACQP
jgi:1,4-dihydroxy-6-naphthoate synthase